MIRRKPQPVDSGTERQIIIGMITNTGFLTQIQSFYSPEYMESDFTRIIAEWCNDYFQNFGQAPGKDIQDIFRRYTKNNFPEDTKEQIKTFLISISDEYEKTDKQFNVEYHIANSEEHFRLVNIRLIKQKLESSLIASDITRAENALANFKRPVRQKTKGIEIFTDSEIAYRAFDETRRNLFSLPGKLGKTIGAFERGNLFAVLAGSGVGKSWWLMLIALRAAFQGLNVLFVSYEMSEEQMYRRYGSWVTGLPIPQHAGKIPIPVFDCWKNQIGECRKSSCKKSIIKEVAYDSDGGIDKDKTVFMTTQESIDIGYIPCTECRGNREYQLAVWHKIVEREAITPEISIKKFGAAKRIGRAGQIRVVQFPSRTQTIEDLQAYRANLRHYEGFMEDVLITDYADKMIYRGRDHRLGLGEIWEGHKSIAQADNIFVATGSQTSADRSGKDIKEGDWSEAILKKNVLDSAMSINQTKQERLSGIFRMEPMKKRHEGFEAFGQVWVLGQYKVGRPYLDSEIKGGHYFY